MNYLRLCYAGNHNIYSDRRVMNIYVKRFSDREIIKTVNVDGKSEIQCERVVGGLLINMNTYDYFIDDDEVTEHFNQVTK